MFADDKPAAFFWLAEELYRNGPGMTQRQALLGHIEARGGLWGYVLAVADGDAFKRGSEWVLVDSGRFEPTMRALERAASAAM